MQKYKNILDEYYKSHNILSSLMVKLTMNIKQDHEGLMTKRTQFSERLYELLGSIEYRLNAVYWHLIALCNQHDFYEKKLAKEGMASSEWINYKPLVYLFDDVIFNLVSLCDYFGSYLYLAFVNPNDHKKMWNSLANAAQDSKNDFSNCILAKLISKHNRQWFANLTHCRSEIIHYKLLKNNARIKEVIDVKKRIQETQLMYSVPDYIVRRLKLTNCHKNETGVDLQFGSIEIGKRSIAALQEIAEIAINKCTLNTIELTSSKMV